MNDSQTMNLFDINNTYPSCMFSRIQAKRVIFSITSVCNRSCVYCFSNAEIGHQIDKNYSELSLKEILKIAQKLKELEYTDICITGGEPFMRRDILYILEGLSYMGFSIAISTNCDYVDNTEILKMLELNVRSINLSLDSHIPSVNDTVRGKGSFDKTVKIIMKLVGKDLRLRVHTVITKHNRSHIDSVSRFLYNLGVKLHTVSSQLPFLEPYSPELSNRLLATRAECSEMEIQYIRIKLLPYQKPYYWLACSYGSNLLYISPDGALSPCYNFVERPCYSANILKDDWSRVTSFLAQLDQDSKFIKIAPCVINPAIRYVEQ